MKVVAAILAAGRGERFGGDKTGRLLGGRPVWRWSYDTFAADPLIDRVFVVTAAERVTQLATLIPSGSIIAGGETRTQSSRIAVDFAASLGADILLIQDAARPFMSSRLISLVIEAVTEAGAAAPAVPVIDTIKEISADGVRTLRRDQLVAMQTPQGARVELLLRAHAAATGDATDDLALIEALGVHPRIVPGEPSNFKITSPEDFDRASAIVGSETRTGIGYDVHPISDDSARELWLGGVHFPGHPALAGHSDADVLLHAITDALLGAAALGDIGLHFPPSDPQWKNRSSVPFLRHAASLLLENGWQVVHIDASCIAESPKIMPRAEEMRAAIAQAVGITTDRVSVKATTNERLGFIGRGEGIAAMAVATISRGTKSV